MSAVPYMSGFIFRFVVFTHIIYIANMRQDKATSCQDDYNLLIWYRTTRIQVYHIVRQNIVYETNM